MLVKYTGQSQVRLFAGLRWGPENKRVVDVTDGDTLAQAITHADFELDERDPLVQAFGPDLAATLAVYAGVTDAAVLAGVSAKTLSAVLDKQQVKTVTRWLKEAGLKTDNKKGDVLETPLEGSGPPQPEPQEETT